jgi:hypothetical protein
LVFNLALWMGSVCAACSACLHDMTRPPQDAPSSSHSPSTCRSAGVLTRDGHTIADIRTHIYETDPEGEIFSRDCAEYHVQTPDGHQLVILANHLKSKGYGSPGDPIGARKRARQAARIAQIYTRLIDAGVEYIAVTGDLNDDPTSDALKPLLAEHR